MVDNDESLELHLVAQRKTILKKCCDECGKRIKPTFKATSDPLDWFFLTCDTCMEEFCPKCCDVDDNGICQCYTCYESTLHQEKK